MGGRVVNGHQIHRHRGFQDVVVPVEDRPRPVAAVVRPAAGTYPEISDDRSTAQGAFRHCVDFARFQRQMIEGGNALQTALVAALANLDQRLRDIEKRFDDDGR